MASPSKIARKHGAKPGKGFGGAVSKIAKAKGGKGPAKKPPMAPRFTSEIGTAVTARRDRNSLKVKGSGMPGTYMK